MKYIETCTFDSQSAVFSGYGARDMVKRSKNVKPTVTSQQTTTQYVAVLVFLAILNVVFFFSHGYTYSRVYCTTDVIFETLTRYIEGNGYPLIEECIPEQCLKPSANSVREFSNAVRYLVTECNKPPIEVPSGVILTLVTTFADHVHTDVEKITVHNNTILNWAKLKPRVNLILFSNDSHWTDIARTEGWDVIAPKNTSVKDRPPILKEMFAAARSRYDTPWYGYVNADILFTGKLLDHLDMLTHYHNATSRRIMLTGRRTNVQNVSLIDPLSDDSLKALAKSYGFLYKEDAEDFFITTKSFPWESILPVVVGRPAYDNWLVAEARCRLKTDVIDVSDTLLALHQTTVKGGNLEGHSHKENDINFHIFKANKLKPNFLAGLTTCTAFNTFSTLCDTIGLSRRSHFGAMCGCDK